jgi:hypothetical protein
MVNETIQEPSYTVSIKVAQSPEKVFAAINNVRGWWSQNIQGDTDKLGAEWDYRYKTMHACKMKVTEWVPGRRVAWKVLENKFGFLSGPDEWVGTTVLFEIEPKGGETELRFTHQGLVKPFECYQICSQAWNTYIKESLKDLIEMGQGQPNGKE